MNAYDQAKAQKFPFTKIAPGLQKLQTSFSSSTSAQSRKKRLFRKVMLSAPLASISNPPLSPIPPLPAFPKRTSPSPPPDVVPSTSTPPFVFTQLPPSGLYPSSQTSQVRKGERALQLGGSKQQSQSIGKQPESQSFLVGLSQLPVILLRISGSAQLLGPHEPSALTSFKTDLQEVHRDMRTYWTGKRYYQVDHLSRHR